MGRVLPLIQHKSNCPLQFRAVSSSTMAMLPQHLEFEHTSLDQRKDAVRDIVSSFSDSIHPSEFCPDVYMRITEAQGQRPPSEWTIMADLHGTLMQWGVHNPGCWTFINLCQPANNRTVLFVEKLQRLVVQALGRYDEIFRLLAYGTEAGPLSLAEVTTLVPRVGETAEEMRNLVAAADNDLETRPIGQGATAKVLLETLQRVCERSVDVLAAMNLPAPPERDGPGSLFEALIGSAPDESSMAILEALERASALSPGILHSMSDVLVTTGRLLWNAHPPIAFWQRFQRLAAHAGVAL